MRELEIKVPWDHAHRHPHAEVPGSHGPGSALGHFAHQPVLRVDRTDVLCTALWGAVLWGAVSRGGRVRGHTVLCTHFSARAHGAAPGEAAAHRPAGSTQGTGARAGPSRLPECRL